MTPAARAFAGAPVPAAEAARIDPVLADLNVEQREAVTHG